VSTRQSSGKLGVSKKALKNRFFAVFGCFLLFLGLVFTASLIYEDCKLYVSFEDYEYWPLK
jgi:hypothetical protein